MFARHVTLRLKPGAKEYAQKVVLNELLPLLNKYQGLRDVLLLMSPDGKEAVGITLWDSQEAADVYQRESSAIVQEITSRYAESLPELKTFDVAYASALRRDAR